jgi:outer membrane protein
MAGFTNDVAVARETSRVRLLGSGLRDYVAFAVTNRPSVEAARLAVSNAALALVTATSDQYLQMSLSGGYSQSTANAHEFSWHQRRGKGTADVSFDLLICDFGRIDARERAAREELASAKRSLVEAELEVFNEVCQAYFAVMRSDALLEVARTNEFMHAEHLRQAESLFGAGEAKKLDVLKARVDLSDARLETINASNNVITAGAEFLRSLGLESDRASREDVIGVSANALESMKGGLPATAYSATEALQIARTNSPSLMVLRARLRAAVADVDYAVADLMPKITLSSAFSFADPAWNWSWGFRAVQSVLDGFRRETAVHAAVVAMKSARTAVEAAEQKLSCDLAVAAATRDNARQSLATARVEVAQARENFENVMMQYRVGDASRLDFTDAAGTLASALGARVKAFYSAEMAEAVLVRLTGLDPWPAPVSAAEATIEDLAR